METESLRHWAAVSDEEIGGGADQSTTGKAPINGIGAGANGAKGQTYAVPVERDLVAIKAGPTQDREDPFD